MCGCCSSVQIILWVLEAPYNWLNDEEILCVWSLSHTLWMSDGSNDSIISSFSFSLSLISSLWSADVCNGFSWYLIPWLTWGNSILSIPVVHVWVCVSLPGLTLETDFSLSLLNLYHTTLPKHACMSTTSKGIIPNISSQIIAKSIIQSIMF